MHKFAGRFNQWFCDFEITNFVFFLTSGFVIWKLQMFCFFNQWFCDLEITNFVVFSTSGFVIWKLKILCFFQPVVL
jgi:hypothetical protein